MQRRADALTRLTAFEFVQSHPEQFNIPPDLNLDKVIGDFQAAIAAFTAAASKCVNTPLDSQAALNSTNNIHIPAEVLPVRKIASPTQTAVPNVVGIFEPLAISALDEAGLKEQRGRVTGSGEIGMVTGQFPIAGTIVDIGP